VGLTSLRCLVTGGGGFIGSHVVDALLLEGHTVRVFDNFSTGDRRNLLHVDGALEVVEGDLRSFERVAHAMRGCELVFHLAALPSVPRSVQDPLTSSEVNVTGTLNVLLAARDAGVQRVIYSSSSSVYGASAHEIRREDHFVSPLSPYGVSKYAAEAYCRSFFHVYGLETVSLRYFNVFGPRQSPISEYAAVIPRFISAALLHECPVIYGDGAQSRDFTSIENVVDANLRATNAAGVAGETFNVGCGHGHSVKELLVLVESVTGWSLQPVFAPPRVGDVRKSIADISKAREMLGYEPRISVTAGLENVHAWFVNEPTLLARINERRQWVALAS
jgi:UDP-glucose 4-epimerase